MWRSTRWCLLLGTVFVYTTWEDLPEVARSYRAEYTNLTTTKTTTAEEPPYNHTVLEDEANATVAEDLSAAKEFHAEVELLSKGLTAASERSDVVELEYRRLRAELVMELREFQKLTELHNYLAAEAKGIVQVRGDPVAIKDLGAEFQDQMQLMAMLSVTEDELYLLNNTEARTLRMDRDKKDKEVDRFKEVVPREERQLHQRIQTTTAAQLEQHPAITEDGRFNVTAFRVSLKIHAWTYWRWSGWERACFDITKDWRLYVRRVWTQWTHRRYAALQWHRRHTSLVMGLEARWHQIFVVDSWSYFVGRAVGSVFMDAGLLVTDQYSQALAELWTCASEMYSVIDTQFHVTHRSLAAATFVARSLRDAVGWLSQKTQHLVRRAAQSLRQNDRYPPLIRANPQPAVLAVLLSPIEIRLAYSLITLPIRVLGGCLFDLLALLWFLVYGLPRRLLRKKS